MIDYVKIIDPLNSKTLIYLILSYYCYVKLLKYANIG